MEMEGAWPAQVGTENKYQYNGKELVEDFGWNWSDYGARGYDASVGRWWSVDPMAEAYHSLSVYHYGLNNPIANVDLFGMMSSNPNDIYKERAEKREARRKETDRDAKQRTTFTAYFVDDTQGSDGKKLGKGDLGAIMGYASGIFAGNNIDEITFKTAPRSQFFDKNGNKKRLSFWELFISVSSFAKKRSVGYSDVAFLDGITDTWGYNEAERALDPRTYINWENGNIRLHSNPLYAAGYVAAHELLHQLIDKALLWETGRANSKFPHMGSNNLNADADFVTIPRGPVKNSKGRVGMLHDAEKIPEPLLLKINKYLFRN